jgi:DNA-binding response OmpR family regulator
MAKIMAAEDRPETLGLIERILTRAGHEFVGVLSGEECLKRYEREKPDLILLDIVLPGIDGYKVYEEIKARHKGQKIAFLTALDIGPQAQAKLFKLGKPHYIPKPFDPSELVNKVEEILRE